MVIGFEDEELVAKAGDVIFVNAGVPHRTFSIKPRASGLVQFRESDYVNGELSRIVRYSRKMHGIENTPVTIVKSKELFDVLTEIIEEGEASGIACDLFVKSGIYKVLGILCRMGILKDADTMLAERDVQKILPVLSHVNTNYADDIKLSDVSAMLSFDESYFCRLFKNATGATFTEYLNFVRISKAEKLLKKSQKSILEISEAVGFSSVSYFNRIFKKYHHVSPRAYRGMLCQNI
jgi:AraC-like DNA-binding protein